MARPPKCLLGTPIECTSVQIADVPAFQSPPTLPQVLLIRNIPIESPELFKQSLHSALVGHTIKECVIQDNEAYIKFQDQKCKMMCHLFQNVLIIVGVGVPSLYYIYTVPIDYMSNLS